MYRAWWSLFLSEVAAVGEKGHKEALEKVMALPEVELAQLAASNPNYRLAVVDTQHGIGFQEEADYFRVVKMEGK